MNSGYSFAVEVVHLLSGDSVSSRGEMWALNAALMSRATWNGVHCILPKEQPGLTALNIPLWAFPERMIPGCCLGMLMLVKCGCIQMRAFHQNTSIQSTHHFWNASRKNLSFQRKTQLVWESFPIVQATNYFQNFVAEILKLAFLFTHSRKHN